MITGRFVRKYMRLAKFIGEDDNPCYSRKIGAIITTATGSRILGTGYNGPPPGTPHTDSAVYLRDYFWPQLTRNERESLKLDVLQTDQYKDYDCDDEFVKDKFVRKYTNCKVCPRRLVGAKSGQRTELCSCGHAERHAITNAACDLTGAVIFCWCGVPCLQCSDAIIQARLSMVHCLDEDIYHDKSEWLLNKGNVQVIKHKREIFDGESTF